MPRLPATLMNIADYGIVVGGAAELVVPDCRDPAIATAEIAPVLMGCKAGRKTFTRSAATLHRPAGAATLATTAMQARA